MTKLKDAAMAAYEKSRAAQAEDECERCGRRAARIRSPNSAVRKWLTGQVVPLLVVRWGGHPRVVHGARAT